MKILKTKAPSSNKKLDNTYSLILWSGAPYDVIISSLGIHALVGHGSDENDAQPKYQQVFKIILDSLIPGGHLVYADHVGVLPLYRQSYSTSFSFRVI